MLMVISGLCDCINACFNAFQIFILQLSNRTYILSEQLIREGVQLWGLINDKAREGNVSLIRI